MRKIILIAALGLFCTAASVSAQGGRSVNKDSHLKKIERSNEDIANPKKNTKWATWTSRGDVFTEAGAAVTAQLYRTLDEASVRQIYGNNPEIGTETYSNRMYTVYSYPDIKVYLDADGFVAMWVPQTVIIENPFPVAYEAYAKAYELDSKSAAKVREGIEKLSIEYKKMADNERVRGNFEAAADGFAEAYEMQKHPAVNVVDTVVLYNAGLFYVHALDFAKAQKYLEETLKYGYEDGGNLHFYMYYAYYGQGMPDKAMSILKEGLAKYPNNSNIIEGLVTLYNNTEGADPAEIIPLVEKTIEEDPTNHLLWSGLGGVYDKLGQHDKAVEAYKKSVELAPNDFVNNFNLGFSIASYADKMQGEAASITSVKEYNQKMEEVNDEYEAAIQYLEAAHKLRPTDPRPITLLKSITYRLREREGIQEKYDYYDELFKQLNK